MTSLPLTLTLILTLALLGVGALGLWHGELFGTGFGAIEAAAVGGIAPGALAQRHPRRIQRRRHLIE